ncbi:hypothetical protein INT45_008735 [Circinella minor]|uniref:Uncharacterized protein n=1 Tax=Circinella minor TaxID=1195481 RepID=A0A8H7S6S0_9FUNG|nr:hypothetical protein INT45_008735 [Circinella minor]
MLHSLRTIISAKCLTLGPFSASPLSPRPHFTFDVFPPMVVSRSRPVMCEPPPIMVKKQEEEKCPIKYFSCFKVYGHKRLEPLNSHINDTGPVLALGLNLGLHSWADILSAMLVDEIDLLCEHCAATYSSASAAKVSAYVQHQNKHSSSMPTDDAFLVLSLKHDAIA